jgi:helicase SWR1
VARGPHRRSNHRTLAAQLALRVQNHLESRAGIADRARDKARLQEEKRLRALAKSTVKAVVAEWKKVVYVGHLPSASVIFQGKISLIC